MRTGKEPRRRKSKEEEEERRRKENDYLLVKPREGNQCHKFSVNVCVDGK